MKFIKLSKENKHKKNYIKIQLDFNNFVYYKNIDYINSKKISSVEILLFNYYNIFLIKRIYV